MLPKPKTIKSKIYQVEHKNEYPINDEDISFKTETYDDDGKLIEKRWTLGSFHHGAEDLIWTYEYDAEGRLSYIESNMEQEPFEWHNYYTDENGNEVEIETSRIIDDTIGFERESIFTKKNPQGVLLERWRLLANDFEDDNEYDIVYHEVFNYDENGNLSEVIEYGDHKFDSNGNIIEAKEKSRLTATVEKSELKKITICKRADDSYEALEKEVFCKDSQGNIHPKESLFEKGGTCIAHLEYEYLDDAFTHYIIYSSNDFKYGYTREEVWEEY